MRFVTVRVTCTGCGDLIMAASQMRVVTGRDEPVGVFDCPGCKLTSAVVIPKVALGTLIAGGAGHATLDAQPDPADVIDDDVARFRALLDHWDGTPADEPDPLDRLWPPGT